MLKCGQLLAEQCLIIDHKSRTYFQIIKYFEISFKYCCSTYTSKKRFATATVTTNIRHFSPDINLENNVAILSHRYFAGSIHKI